MIDDERAHSKQVSQFFSPLALLSRSPPAPPISLSDETQPPLSDELVSLGEGQC